MLNFIRGRSGAETFWALQDVNFAVERGEALGIIGRNGSGKSTLLSCLTGIYRPTRGTVGTHGRVAALLELGTGFHVELSGRDNIFLNASMYGMRNREIARRLPDIIDYAELGDFIDAPMKTYSTGMYSRLAFAVAVHLDPDILLLDEILSVGDQSFQRKCVQKMQEFLHAGKTIVLVSHALGQIVSMCRRAIWLDGGKVVLDGGSVEVVAAYEGQMGEIPEIAWRGQPSS
ncbi:MAG: ABC transporter ATP-binding protein [Armatimonadota bacterium]|nr:MAG: ABC transporter ATP-binding protein [Armatimonadota bacterium]